MTEIFAVAPFKRLLKETGSRVSEDAAEALAEVSEEVGFVLMEEAIKVASEDGRKTVRQEDISRAVRRLW